MEITSRIYITVFIYQLYKVTHFDHGTSIVTAYPYFQPYGYPMNCNMSRVFMDMTEEDRKCLEERKYWCFMLSRFDN